MIPGLACIFYPASHFKYLLVISHIDLSSSQYFKLTGLTPSQNVNLADDTISLRFQKNKKQRLVKINFNSAFASNTISE